MATMLVTGGHGELGSVVTRHAERAGWSVIAPTSRDYDLRVIDDVERLVQTLPDDLRAVVHLVGGITAGQPLESTSVADIRTMFELNVHTTVHVLHATLPMLKRHGGCIITIGAQSVVHPVPDRAGYASSKAAVAALTLAIAEEGRAVGVRANCILPSVIRTASNLSWADAATAETWITPEEIAVAIMDLCRPECSVNGALIPMFGRIPY